MSASASRKALSKIACNRLQKELVEWQVNPPAGFKHKVTDNLQRWVIEVHGAPGTLYANETFQLQVDFPEHYPMEAPQAINNLQNFKFLHYFFCNAICYFSQSCSYASSHLQQWPHLLSVHFEYMIVTVASYLIGLITMKLEIAFSKEVGPDLRNLFDSKNSYDYV
ncbi:hypothetical protein AMTR_s00002p00234950 [Amborella trichopoda]|uniref:UBC core domain-containing protein n=1 Tax=Amborella trichopoda TaxID=13333 RepID=W1NUB1_AMBTC|nr:hypothetical protein AMTR_s00002p00234950 [Amborella trichopoda]